MQDTCPRGENPYTDNGPTAAPASGTVVQSSVLRYGQKTYPSCQVVLSSSRNIRIIIDRDDIFWICRLLFFTYIENKMNSTDDAGTLQDNVVV